MIDPKINKLSYFDCCKILNKHPVFVIYYFQYKGEVFFSGILKKNNLLGKITSFVIRIEYRFRGSLYIHCLLWTENPPVLNPDSIVRILSILV